MLAQKPACHEVWLLELLDLGYFKVFLLPLYDHTANLVNVFERQETTIEKQLSIKPEQRAAISHVMEFERGPFVRMFKVSNICCLLQMIQTQTERQVVDLINNYV